MAKQSPRRAAQRAQQKKGTPTKRRAAAEARLVAERKRAQERFLAAYADWASISRASAAAKVGRRTHYDWYDTDPEYASRFDEAREAAIEALEAEARRRALKGVQKPVYQGGKRVGYVQEYSDTLLIFLLKGHRPDIYRERHEHSGPKGGPIPVDSRATVTFYLPDNGRRPST